jgi:hypothetical protein
MERRHKMRGIAQNPMSGSVGSRPRTFSKVHNFFAGGGNQPNEHEPCQRLGHANLLISLRSAARPAIAQERTGSGEAILPERSSGLLALRDDEIKARIARLPRVIVSFVFKLIFTAATPHESGVEPSNEEEDQNHQQPSIAVSRLVAGAQQNVEPRSHERPPPDQDTSQGALRAIGFRLAGSTTLRLPALNKLQGIRRNGPDKLKPPWWLSRDM